MSYLQKIIKLTQAQYDSLAAGGTVGSYTGLNDNYLYLIQDSAEYATVDALDAAVDDLTDMIATKANDSDVVKLTGDQTVSGVKTFNDNMKFASGKIIYVDTFFDTYGNGMINNQSGTAVAIGSSAKPTKVVSSVQPTWLRSGQTVGTFAMTSDIPTSLKNPNALTFGSQTYDGSSAKTITASDLGALTAHQDISGKANLSGGNIFSGNQVFTGYLDVRGTAAEKHLKTRGISGSDGNGNEGDLHLLYQSSYCTKFGTSANGSLNADGTITEAGTLLSNKYLGKTATAADSTKLNGQAASYYLDYSNFTNKPTIGNGTVGIRQNGNLIKSFTLNSADSMTVDLTDTTYDEATSMTAGLISATDKAKLDAIDISAGIDVDDLVTKTYLENNYYTDAAVDELVGAKQDTLISGTNIKTVNGTSLLGSGNVAISVGNGTIAIRQNGSQIGSFTTNQTTSTVIDLSTPTLYDIRY